MTGNTPTMLIGLGFVVAVLPLGLLVLSRAYTTIERAHPFDVSPGGTPDGASQPVTASEPAATAEPAEPDAPADIPVPRAAHPAGTRSAAPSST